MKTTRRNVLATLSTGVLAVLLCGYVAEFGPVIRYSTLTATPPAYHGASAMLAEGRIRVWWMTSSGSPSSPFVGPARSWVFHPRLPSLRHSLWEFDAHALPIQSGTQAYLIGFPIWVIALPFTIAPALWLKRRRERRDTRGFAVELNESTAPLSATN